VSQLGLGAAAQIAGAQADGEMAVRLERREQRLDARHDGVARRARELVVQRRQIALKQLFDGRLVERAAERG
jgi:hypothetical protein